MRTVYKFLSLIPAALATAAAVSCTGAAQDEAPALKPRLVVLTDISPSYIEPDDNESAVHLLSYADRFEIEAIATNVGWSCEPCPPEWLEVLLNVANAYEKDLPNLAKRSSQTSFKSLEEENGKQELGYWPSADYIRSRCVHGSVNGGFQALGPDNDSDGSELLIRLADEDDPRPIYVTAWGGANTLSQAIWKVKQTRSPEELRKFVRKFRLYTITDQDMGFMRARDHEYSSHKWLLTEFKEDLMFVWDESAWMNQNNLGRSSWENYEKLIQPMGALGAAYPKFKFGVEGDTPSFLNCLPTGLNDPEDPTQVGWGGVHYWGPSADGVSESWTNCKDPVRSISNEYERQFFPDEFNDFAARMQWAATGNGNVNPVVVVDGKGGLAPIEVSVSAGKKVSFDASKSFDPDGDALSFRWWVQKQPEGDILPVLEGADAAKVSFTVPEDAAGKKIHLVCEVHDSGEFQLVAYRRVILSVK